MSSCSRDRDRSKRRKPSPNAITAVASLAATTQTFDGAISRSIADLCACGDTAACSGPAASTSSRPQVEVVAAGISPQVVLVADALGARRACVAARAAGSLARVANRRAAWMPHVRSDFMHFGGLRRSRT